MDKLILSEDLIFDRVPPDFDQAIRMVSRQLQQWNIVRDTYAQAVIDRERVYPTGLVGMHGGFAIPHTDCEHCHHSALSILRPEVPMEFVRMDDHSETVDCSLIILLTIADQSQQLPMLRRLMRALQDEKTVRTLREEPDHAVVLKVLQDLCA